LRENTYLQRRSDKIKPLPWNAPFHRVVMNRQDIMETINKDLLEILACPKCKGAVKLLEGKGILCEKCRLVYEIRDGIPIMLIDEAKKAD
jgi:uncharacterized protein YbaR (Trm112 family)